VLDRRIVLTSLCTLALLPCAANAAQRLTVNDIISTHPVSGIPPAGFTWSPDGSRFVYTYPALSEKQSPPIRLHDVRAGEDRLLFRAKSEERGTRSRAIGQIVWSPGGRRIAYVDGGNLAVAGVNGERVTVLAKDADDPQWSPDGTRIAYVHDDDMYSVTVATRRIRRITRGGSKTRINGDPDWLTSEEMDVAHAYAWSPKGDAIAYLSFDESHVPAFPIQDYLPVHNTVEYQRYPLAGDPNPRISLHVVDLRTGAMRMLYDGARRDEYLVSFVWTPDGTSVLQEILDRPQRHLRLELFSRDGRDRRVVLREVDPRFVDVQPAPVFLNDGRRFVWLSQRGGMQTAALVDLQTGTERELERKYPVASIVRVDDRSGVVYVSALAPERRSLALVAVPLSGGTSRIVTPEVGWHTIAMPRKGDAYVDTFSSFTHPPCVTIRRLSGTQSAALFTTPSLARFELGRTRALEIPSRWGPLDAELTLPKDFDPAKRYPVIVSAYGGPLPVGDALPSADRWPGLYPFLLAQHGFLVFSIDGPASNPDRVANEQLFTHRMGEIAMAGQLAGVAWLKRQPYVDASRLGLFGWSYGGYLTAFTLTHAPDVFRSGIAGAPPADWRFYDSAYTERYMGLPKHHAIAYAQTSVLPSASRLRARLLVIQGSSDDNVHLMNSIALLRAFIDAGKQVDYFLYPGARHGVTGVPAQRNLYTRMLDWWETTLRRCGMSFGAAGKATASE
jgi:dipeptidyl-peptidase-4